MNRIALIGVVAFAAACDLPLVMVEVEAPSVCVTRQVDIDPTSLTYVVSNANADGDLPSEMALNLSNALGTQITVDDTIVDLPAEAKDLLDLDVQIERVRIQALAPNESALDQVSAVVFTIVPPAGSGLTEVDVVAYDRAVAGTPPGGAIEASGDPINFAKYLYSGQLRFKYRLDATIDTAGLPWSVELTACVATTGKVEVSYSDVQKNL